MTAAAPITILLAEDHEIVRQGLRALLELTGQFRVMGEARDGREAVKLARDLRPDVILMDIAMPVLNGLEATREILAAKPASRILILSAHADQEYVKRASLAGAAGFILKQTTADKLAKAITEAAHARAVPKHPEKTSGRKDPFKVNSGRLTPRESEVLQLVAGGASNKQVGLAMGISIKTVEKHRQHVMDKTRIHDVAGLTRYAISIGVTPAGR
jgi:DNA-binding NarL/FixJ family response regulator